MELLSILRIKVIFVILVSFITRNSNGSLCRLDAYEQHSNERLHNHVLRKFTADTVSYCALSCLSSDQCISFNWQQMDKKCEINNTTKTANPTDIVSNLNWSYFGDANYIGQCAYEKCEHGGVCKPSCGDEDRFVCQCTSSYQGRRCHIHPACSAPLGLASGNISDSLITASSENINAKSHVRLSHSLGWWASSSDSTPWVKIQFLAVLQVTGVIVKGGIGRHGWVTKFGLSYGEPLKEASTEYVDHSGTIKAFTGNTDADTEVRQLLDPIIRSSSLTFRILSCHGNCSLRMEILGCRYEAREVGWADIKNRPWVGTGTNQLWITKFAFPSSSIVTHWRFWSGRLLAFKALVLRKVDSGGQIYDIIGVNDIPARDTGQAYTYEVPDDERIFAQVGDVIGYFWTLPVIPQTHTGDADNGDVQYGLKYRGLHVDKIYTNARLSSFALHNRAYSIKAITISDITNIFESPFGMEDGTIPNSQITSSSYYTPSSLFPYLGRLNNAKYWATSGENPSAPWIQVVIPGNSPAVFTAVQTQGSSLNLQEWVKTFQIQTGRTGSTLQDVMNGNVVATFAANTDKSTIVTSVFPEPVCGQVLRIIPKTWNAWVSLRFEVLGYQSLPSCQ